MVNKLTQEEIKALARLYTDARERLLDTIINYKGVGTKTYANTILRQLQQELKRLQENSDSFIETAIPREYRAALRSTYAYFKRNRLRMKSPSAFASIHTDSLHEISREMQYRIADGLATVGRQVIRYVDTARDEALRAAGLRQAGTKTAAGGTVQDMRNSLLSELQGNGFMTIQYGEGNNARQVPVDVYAGMVARSTTREAGNTARINQISLNGYDLVKMSTHYPTCSICSQHQGRVYSISGNDKRFPPLSLAFGTYNNIHPNCRHVITSWIESLRTPEEMQEAIDFSNRPFEDSRSAKETALYKEQQDKNRQARNTIYQYERYKERLGDDAPKSWGAFARLKKKGGQEWEDLQYYYRYLDDRPAYCVKIDRELQKLGIDKGRAFPADNTLEIAGWRPHASNRLVESSVSKKAAAEWKDAAQIMFSKYPEPNTLLSYYTNYGIIGIRKADGMVQTGIAADRFNDETPAILEVIGKYVKASR